MLSSTSFNKSFNRYRRKSKIGFRRYYKTSFKNRCRRQYKWLIIFNDFKQDDRFKMNELRCGCNVVINHTIAYNFDTIISDKINYDDMYRTLDMVARDQYYDDY